MPARQVRVELADLPFPRLRTVKDLGATQERSFSRLVGDLQAELDALAEPKIVLRPAEGLLLCKGRRIALSPSRLTFYALLAERRRDGCAVPECLGCAGCHLPASEIEATFVKALSDRLRATGSWGVKVTSWSAKRFLQERRKINGAIERVLRGASAPYRVQSSGRRRARLYGIPAPKSAILIEST